MRQGEVIVRGGAVVRPLDIEKLDALELRQRAIRWQTVAANIAIAVFVTILLLVFGVYPNPAMDLAGDGADCFQPAPTQVFTD